jgi:hypothetical protein
MALRFIVLFFLAGITTFILHEGAHWLTGELLGYNMWVNINSAGLAEGEYQSGAHAQIVSISGPIFTVLQGVIAFVIVRKSKSLIAFTFLFSALMMRFIAGLMSFIIPNDEARVSEYLGLGTWTLHILVIAFLLGLTIFAGRHMKFRLRDYGLAYLVVSMVAAIIVFIEPSLPRLSL